MATLAPSLAFRPRCFNCGPVESSSPSKLCAASASHYVCKWKCTGRPARLDIEKTLSGQVSQNAVTTRPDLRACASSRVSVDETQPVFTPTTEVDKLQKVSTYLFRTDLGGPVMV